MSIDIDVKTVKIGFWHMPRTFYVLLFIEFWERFAFYGMQSIAISYIFQKFSLSLWALNSLFFSFNSLLYAFLIFGGIIGDKLLGLSRSYFIGIMFFIFGYVLLSITQNINIFYFALSLILVGNIFFKVNSSNYISRIFETNDARLDSAFNYFYMLVNVGSFVGLFFIPFISKYYNYQTGMVFCALALLIALLCYLVFSSRFKLSDNQVGKKHSNKKIRTIGIVILSLLISYLLSLLLPYEDITRLIFYVMTGGVLLSYLITASKLHKNEAQGMYVALILLLQAVIFWVLYMQLFSNLACLSSKSVNLNFIGYVLPHGFIQIFNPLFIIILSPILARVYEKFHNKSIDIHIPTKFAYGMFMLCISFFILGVLCSYALNNNSVISVAWLFIVIGFYSVAELLIIAVGPSMVAKLLPKRMGGYAQGIWYLTCAMGIKIGANISDVSSFNQYNCVNNNLRDFKSFCYINGTIAVIITFLVFLILRRLNNKIISIMQHK